MDYVGIQAGKAVGKSLKISIDVSKAKAQASKLEQAAEVLEDGIKQLKKAQKAVAEGWEGDSATAIDEKLSTSVSKLKEYESSIRNIASLIRQVAVEIAEQDKLLAAGMKISSRFM